MGKKALLIAIKETKNRPDLGLSSLPFAHRDARAVCKCLISHVTITWPFSECSLLTSLTGDHSYQQDDIVVMLDSPEIPEHLQPTGPNIVSPDISMFTYAIIGSILPPFRYVKFAT